MKTLLIFSLIFTTLNVQSVTYYVAKSGDNNYPGTEAQPWLTIQKAADTLTAGDSVFIKSGTYTETSKIVPKNSGVSNALITYAAYPGDSPVIDGSSISLANWFGIIDLTDKANIKIRGVTILNSDAAGIFARRAENIYVENNNTSNSWSSGIQFWQSTNIFVLSNDVQFACMGNNGTGGGDLQECITLSGVDTFEIKYNHVHDRPISTDSNGGEGIDAKEACRYGEIAYNVVHGIKRELGIYVDGWRSHEHDIEVFNNTVYDSHAGIIIAVERSEGSVKNVKIYNNIIYNNQYAGIEIAANDDDAPKENIYIFNNICYSNGYHSTQWGGGIYVSSKNVKNIFIKNNICSKNVPWQIATATASESDLTVQNNLINSYLDYSGGTEHSIKGENSVEANPEFSNINSYNFNLLPGSPAINAGTNAGWTSESTDFAGNPRVIGSAVDIGAYEFVSNYTSPPAVPENISATDGTELSSVNVNWNVAARATYYHIFRNGTNDLSGATNISENVGFGTFIDYSVEPEKIYYYWVRAINNTGTSDFSNVDSGFSLNGVKITAEEWKPNKKQTKLKGKNISPLLMQYFTNNYGIGLIGIDGTYKPTTKNNKVWKYKSADKSIKIIYKEKFNQKKNSYKTKLIYINKNIKIPNDYQFYVSP